MIGRLTQHEAGTQVNLPTVLKYPPTQGIKGSLEKENDAWK